MPKSAPRRSIAQRRSVLARWLALTSVPVLLAACGGGDYSNDGNPTPPAADCSVAEQKTWVGNYMDDWYYWYRLSPRPNPASFNTVEFYFDALLYTGTDPTFPSDRYSFSQSTDSFNRFFGDGQSLGYGVSVAGLEVSGQPTQPLYVRYIEPLSPAATAGVQRGDQVISVNGRSAADLITADDFSALTAVNAGDAVTLLLRRGGIDRSVRVIASVFSLTPVQPESIVITPSGRQLGYVIVKDMITQALAPLETAFARFRSAGVEAVVLDLRYNGGGLVSVAGSVSSYVAGPARSNRVFASLLYNDKRASNNQSFRFSSLASALGSSRVYVLMGPRTCSASEQVINGLRGVGVDVVAIGDTTCGKPVGFLPTPQCGVTYSVVNFESVNERNEGRYFDGFAPSCPVAEDFTKALGTGTEPLLATAARFADSGSCPAAAMREAPLAKRSAKARKPEPGEQQGMIAR
jgi:carboxyl-terminal processing protease